MLWRLPALAICLAAALTAVVSCGEEPEVTELTPQEYADRVRELQDISREPFDSAAVGVFPLSIATEAEYVQQYAVLYEIGIGAGIRFFEDMQSLSPPGVLRDSHLDFVAAGEAHLEALGQIRDVLAGADSWDDLDTLDSTDDQRTSDEMARACRLVEQAIRSEGAEIDLDCEVTWFLGGGASACVQLEIGNGVEETDCDPDPDPGTIDIAPGINGRLGVIPAPPPEGLVAVSEYLEFEGDESVSPVIGLPLNDASLTRDQIAFYSYVDGAWQRVGDVSIRDVGSDDGGLVAEGQFDTLPPNLVVFAE